MLLCTKFVKIITLNLEYFIAQRTAQPSDENKPGVMIRIATISVGLSVAVMILAIAVVLGFKKDITQRVVGFMSHLEVIDVESVRGISSRPMLYSEHIDSLVKTVGGFKSLAPYAIRGGIIKTDDAMLGITLKGVGSGYDMSFFKKHLLFGEIPLVLETVRSKEVLISKYVSDKLMLGVGDRVEMLFVEENFDSRRDLFKVVGIYTTGMEEMDKMLIITDIGNVQRLYGWSENQVSGIEIETQNFDDVDEFCYNLDRKLLTDSFEASANLVVRSVKEIYPNIFDWLKAHNVNALVIIIIMMVVAFFNVASAMLIIVLERIRMVGILKALGMNDSSLRLVFLYRAVMIIFKGLFWGNVVGLGLAIVQKYFHIIKLDSQGYMLSEVPIDIGFNWWLMLNLGAIVTILALLILPSSIISKIRPNESIRYN